MKRFFLSLAAIIVIVSGTVFGEEAPLAKRINITIIGVTYYNEYKTLLDDLKKIVGVEGLVPSREKSGTITVTGRATGDPAIIKNDIQALILDRFKFEGKESKDSLNITLKKL